MRTARPLLCRMHGWCRPRLLGLNFEPPRHHAAGVLGVIDSELPIDGAPWQPAANCHRLRKEIGRTGMELTAKNERERSIQLLFDERDLVAMFLGFVKENAEQRTCRFSAAGRWRYAGRKGAEAKRTIGVER